MDRYSCIIIEDEPLALKRTADFVNKIPFLNLMGTFDNSINGLFYLKANKVDLLFLDINMDELSGIELLENSKIESQRFVFDDNTGIPIHFELSDLQYKGCNGCLFLMYVSPDKSDLVVFE